jgi:hypothetical protein
MQSYINLFSITERLISRTCLTMFFTIAPSLKSVSILRCYVHSPKKLLAQAYCRKEILMLYQQNLHSSNTHAPRAPYGSVRNI